MRGGRSINPTPLALTGELPLSYFLSPIAVFSSAIFAGGVFTTLLTNMDYFAGNLVDQPYDKGELSIAFAGLLAVAAE